MPIKNLRSLMTLREVILNLEDGWACDHCGAFGREDYLEVGKQYPCAIKKDHKWKHIIGLAFQTKWQKKLAKKCKHTSS